VIPSKSFSNKNNFVSVKEHRLKDIGVGTKGIPFLYEWEHKDLKLFGEFEAEIAALTEKIKKSISNAGDNSSKIKGMVREIFTECFKFKSKVSNISKDLKSKKTKSEKDIVIDEKIKELKKGIIEEFKKNKKSKSIDNQDYSGLYENYAERWCLKVKIELKFQELKGNEDFLPYQKSIYFKTTSNGGLEKISLNPVKEYEKGYVFNSTNASSKRSHYVIRDEDETKDMIEVLDKMVNAYRRNYEKIRFVNVTGKDDKEKESRSKNMKLFYDIFNGYDVLKSEHVGLPIVFYKAGKDGEIKNIGRTPYFKISYHKQLDQLIGPDNVDEVDYTRALFGFTDSDVFTQASEKNKRKEYITDYKSRLRFSPINMVGDYVKEEDVGGFVLLTPQPTACGMYLKQNKKDKIVTYADNDCELRGYKYYNILKDRIEPSLKEKKQKENSGKENVSGGMYSEKSVIQFVEGQKLEMKGRIYFKNLSKGEIGLLVLSLDISKFEKINKIDSKIKDKLKNCYESIGGAKPYGYGKVKISVDSIMLEEQEATFDSLIGESHKIDTKLEKYVDGFINEIVSKNGNVSDYFNKIHLDCYIRSKEEVDRKTDQIKDFDWESLKRHTERNKAGGYPSNWVLRDNSC